MVRTQIQLRADQAVAAKRRAAEKGISLSEYIRRSVDEALRNDGKGDRQRRMLQALERIEAAQIKGGAPDVARRHDHYLAEALKDGHVH